MSTSAPKPQPHPHEIKGMELDCKAKEIANMRAERETEVALETQSLQNAELRLKILADIYAHISTSPEIDAKTWFHGELMRISKGVSG